MIAKMYRMHVIAKHLLKKIGRSVEDLGEILCGEMVRSGIFSPLFSAQTNACPG